MADTCSPFGIDTMQKQMEAEFDAWFARLQALTSEALEPDDWTGRWFDGYTPEQALEVGLEED